MARVTLILLGIALLADAGCKPKAPKVTPLQRKEAAHLQSEAEFAISLRDLPRAEDLYAKATATCPDDSDLWISLGACRRKQNNLEGARKAYESALKASKDAYRADSKDPAPVFQQIYVLTLLGRIDDAKALADKAQQDHGNDPRARNFSRDAIDRMLTNETFKGLAL
jgi:tetratricopeptide (TPR) repeat protein